MLKKALFLPVAALAIAAAAATPAQASRIASPWPTATATPADSPSSSPSPTGSPTPTTGPTMLPTPMPTGSPAPPVPPVVTKPLYFLTSLTGSQEVPAVPGTAAGDPTGSAQSLIEINGSKMTFAIAWKGLVPTMAHLHQGLAGADGDVELPLFMSTMPDGSTAAAGSITLTDPGLTAAIISDPAGFYLNVHTAAFPDGAVRGQLHLVRHHRPLLDLLGSTPLQSLMWGDQELATPGGPSVGDPNGHGVGLIRADGRRVSYALEWYGISEPLMAHIHAGAGGTNGPIVVPLFTSQVPDNIFAISGLVTGVAKSLTTAIRTDPDGFYTNLHTVEYPGGAIRGQLFRAGHLAPR